MLALSVIICTRKPREDHIRRTLQGLRAQTLSKDKWELLVVSVAADGALSENLDVSWHPNARFILEEKIGLAQGRLRSIVESKGDILVYVDDDNVLRADYLENALKIGAEYPQLGAWGGSCIPEFEIEPPAELRPYLAGLLVEKRTVAVWSKLPRGNWALPPGAGMVVRSKQAQYYRAQVLNDPLRNSLGPHNKPPRGSEDSDLALSGFKLGFGTGMFPELELTHLIPAQKLNLMSLENLYESFGYGDKLMEAIHDPEARYESQRRIPARFQTGPLRVFLLRMFTFLTRKNRAERRIKLADERGRVRAMSDLRRLGKNYIPPFSG